MGKSGKRKKTFSFRYLFRWCKGKGNADDDRHAYQKQPLHKQARRTDRERRDNTGIEEHYGLKEYRKPQDIESKRDVKNDAPNSQSILYGDTQNKTENDTTEVTKVHVEPLNGAIKAYMVHTSDARVDFPKEVPDDKVDCANSYEDIPFIDADDEKDDEFQTISIAELGIKENNKDQMHDVLVNEIQEWSVIDTVSTTNEVTNQRTHHPGNDLVAFMDTKDKIDDVKINNETEEIVSIAQAWSPLNTQDAIGDDSSEEKKDGDNDILGTNLQDWHVVGDEKNSVPIETMTHQSVSSTNNGDIEAELPITTSVDQDQCQLEKHFKNLAKNDVDKEESSLDVVLSSSSTIDEDNTDDNITNQADNESYVIVENLAAEGEQSLYKGSNLESSSQIDNENTEDHHEPDTHDIDSNSHLITYALNEGSNVETFSQTENDNVDNVTNVQGTNDVVSKPNHVKDADSDEESDNEKEEGTNTYNDEIQDNENTKHNTYYNNFDDDDDTQHTYKNDDDNDSDFESGQEQFQDNLNLYDTGVATGGHSLSKVFKADQIELRPNLEMEAWNKQFDLSEPTYYVASTGDTAKTPLNLKTPEITLPDKSDNVLFYQNKIKSRPPIGHTIEDMLKWMGDYAFLEKNHSYIQWLFPIPGSSGMNYQAQALQDHEIEIMKNDGDIQGRVIRSFRMMLDFYGMEMVDDTFQRNERNWQARYAHLNQSFHNRMRITRIIQSLGELGFTKIQTRWLSFLMQEAMVNKSLNRLGGDSMQYFIDAIKEDDDRHKLYEKYFRYMMGDFSEPGDNDNGNNGETGDNINGDTDNNTNGETGDYTNGDTDDNTNAESDDNTNAESDDNANGETGDYTNGETDDNTNGETDDNTNGETDDNTNGETDDNTNGETGDDINGDTDNNTNAESDDNTYGKTDDDTNDETGDNTNGETGDNTNGETDDNTNGETEDNTNGETEDNTNAESDDSTNGENIEDKSNDNGHNKSNDDDNVSNGCDSGDMYELKTMQNMPANDGYIEQDTTGSILLSDNGEKDFSDDYSTAEEETDYVDNKISESENHVQEGVRTNKYKYGLSNDAQNADLLPSSVTLNSNCDTPITENDNIQIHNTDGGTGETKKEDRTPEDDQSATVNVKFEPHSIGSNDKVTYTTIETLDKGNHATDEDIDANSGMESDDLENDIKDDDADLNSHTGSDDDNEYFVIRSTDGTFAH